MKIIYEGFIFSEQKYGGISRYFYELIKSFKKAYGIKVLLPIIFSNNHYIQNQSGFSHLPLFPNQKIKGKQKFIFLINKISFLIALRRRDFDIVHPTYFDTYFLKYLGTKKMVLTVYDMIHEKFYNDSISDKKKLLCERADLIIAISENTKNDLVEIFNISESKIRVVHLANSIYIANKPKKSIDLPDNYILFIGHRGLYKNFNRFLNAISELIQNNSDLHLICGGGYNFNKKEMEMLKNLNVDKKVNQINLSDDTLSILYQNAQLFIFPSIYEGFGIPILESFSCGCPVACSNTSSFPEIAQDAAAYFDPMDEASIYNCINDLLFNYEYKEKLVDKAYRRLEEFSWEKTATKTLKIYKELAG
jgi:glycosyltransferase involved in cell wall biosynthesis